MSSFTGKALKFAELYETQQKGDTSPLMAANLKQAEDRLEELNGRSRKPSSRSGKRARHCTIGDIRRHAGRLGTAAS